MTDWRSCSVVRDRDGDLWTNYAGMWHTPEMAPFSADILAKYDPTPVLDANGLPVVRTVGDLTARHLGRRVRVGGFEGELVALVALFDGIVTVEVLTVDDFSALRRCTLDTPCEVLP